jgi:hypothetical protein
MKAAFQRTNHFWRGASRLRLPRALLCVLACSGGVSGCERNDPPSWSGPLNIYPLANEPTTKQPSPRAASSSVASAEGSADSGTDASPLFAKDGSLPQTKARPSDTSPLLVLRAKALFRAIQEDEPAVALPFFFPKEAYEQVKAIPNPAADWQRRLVAAFERDIHTLHAKVSPSDVFLGVEIPAERARWVEVDEEGNRLGYYRVYGTKIAFGPAPGEGGRARLDDEKPALSPGPGTSANPGTGTQKPERKTLEVKSMISWRGEWYAVHLSGFK